MPTLGNKVSKWAVYLVRDSKARPVTRHASAAIGGDAVTGSSKRRTRDSTQQEMPFVATEHDDYGREYEDGLVYDDLDDPRRA